ncbi:MAG: hypothetical protein HN417_12550 [Desulfobacula sp.]|jgi:hypothetical protein|nr:hypothetical protein [Desulfobacula sp.]
MQTLKVSSDQIKLPEQIAKKLIGKVIEFTEFQDGFMMKPLEDRTDTIKQARGILRDKRFSTERYFKFKEEDKAIER